MGRTAPLRSTVRADVEHAFGTCEQAAEFRRRIRRRSKKGSSIREEKIAANLAALRAAMRPIRSHVGKLAFNPDFPHAGRLREVSAQIQYEAAALRRMRK